MPAFVLRLLFDTVYIMLLLCHRLTMNHLTAAKEQEQPFESATQPPSGVSLSRIQLSCADRCVDLDRYQEQAA